MLSRDDGVLTNVIHILDVRTWPEGIKDADFGDEEVRNLAVPFQIDKCEVIRAFHKVLEKLIQLTNAIKTIPMYQMNMILL